MWQAEAVKELTLSASTATAVGELTLTLAIWRYISTVLHTFNVKEVAHLRECRSLAPREKGDGELI